MAVLSKSNPSSTGGWKWWLRIWIILCAWLFSPGFQLSAQTTPAREYQIKAAFLYNFAQFIEWPPNAFPDAGTPLVIGVLGDDPFGNFLDETVRGEKVHNRPLVVQRFSRVEDITTCHVLFISRSESAQLDEILQKLKGRSILTTGDVDGFARRGGVVRFTTEKGKIRLRINLEAARAENVTISSRLLKLADIVQPGKD